MVNKKVGTDSVDVIDPNWKAPDTYADGAPAVGGTPLTPADLSAAGIETAPAAQENGQKKPAETKAQRFRRLASRRISKVLHEMDRLIPLANKSQYDWGPEEAIMLMDALEDKVDEIRRAFNGQKRSAPTFSFR